jgi:hypothetical protein
MLDDVNIKRISNTNSAKETMYYYSSLLAAHTLGTPGQARRGSVRRYSGGCQDNSGTTDRTKK